MHVATTIAQARALFDVLPRPFGFVPTMGALHEGHLALVAQAHAECIAVVASVFVNPLQFGANEDLDTYPRTPQADREALNKAGVAVLFAPDAYAMYPAGFSTTVDVGMMGTTLEGAVRPTHFRGVSTVVNKLLNIVRPDALFVGQKDAQQTAVLRKMVRDLEIPTRVAIVPTVRELDGLAKSSRNVYLSADERARAPALHAALVAVRDAMANGTPKGEAVRMARSQLDSLAATDYIDVVDADTFEPCETLRAPAFIVGAARFGTTRLIDNLWIET